MMVMEMINMYTVGILTASDKASIGERVDESGKTIMEILEKRDKYEVIKYIIVPDEIDDIKNALIDMSDNLELNLILTTGGTGFSPRDITPEATEEVIERRVPGIPEAMRGYSLQITPRAMLSRATCGIRNKTLILNMPGSPKAVRESLEYVIESLEHGLDILLEKSKECARK